MAILVLNLSIIISFYLGHMIFEYIYSVEKSDINDINV